MTVFVTGGTGFVGREMLRQLHGAGHHIRLLVRDPRAPTVRELIARHSAECHAGDVLDAASLGDGLRGADAVIHLVGIISEVGNQTFENVHTLATQHVVQAVQKAGVKRFLHMSALGTRSGAVARYHKSKWAAEEIVRNSGLDWTIFRPSIIYGPGDAFVNLFAKISKLSPVVPLIGGGRTRFQPIPVEHVARCFVAALDKPRAVGQTFDLCGDETLTLAQILDSILAITRRKRLTLALPFAIAKFQAGCAEFVFGRILGKAPPLNRDQVLMLQEDNVGDGQAAVELFGLPRISFQAGIEKYLRPPT